MTPEERRVVYAEGLTGTQCYILLIHLDQPGLTVGALAYVTGCNRSTVRQALLLGAERGLLPSRTEVQP